MSVTLAGYQMALSLSSIWATNDLPPLIALNKLRPSGDISKSGMAAGRESRPGAMIRCKQLSCLAKASPHTFHLLMCQQLTSSQRNTTPGDSINETATTDETVMESIQTPLELIESSFQTLRKETEEELLSKLKTCSPAFFERVVVQLLRAMGYGGVTGEGSVTGQSGDGDIESEVKKAQRMSQYYIRRGGKIEGPVSLNVIASMRGKLKPMDFLAESKSGPWASWAVMENRLFPTALASALDELQKPEAPKPNAVQRYAMYSHMADADEEPSPITVEQFQPGGFSCTGCSREELFEAAEKSFSMSGVKIKLREKPTSGEWRIEGRATTGLNFNGIVVKAVIRKTVVFFECSFSTSEAVDFLDAIDQKLKLVSHNFAKVLNPAMAETIKRPEETPMWLQIGVPLVGIITIAASVLLIHTGMILLFIPAILLYLCVRIMSKK